jgi:hypothetical protein
VDDQLCKRRDAVYYGFYPGAVSVARQKAETINMIFVLIYLIEIVAVIFFYFCKRAK